MEDLHLSMNIPLRKLHLQGYKSFARKTELLFGHGITAIVGPNGSGKSNIADALRWVLGERSYSALRSKRTEDMIFHGSEGRRRLGMAQVSLTLDNEGGWFPIDFSEVTITRCAYRPGENEYLINGNRVRLQDLTDLLARSGINHSTYAVIGQGLVDRALSLHPQERRQLLEEAAGVIGYRARRTEILQRLEETEDNLTRVRDIIAEIEPRLARLARQAQEAQQQARLSEQLRESLTIWYGYQWQMAQDRLRRVRRHVQRQSTHLSSIQSQLQHIQAELAQLRDEERQFQAQETIIQERHRSLEETLAEIQRRQTLRQEQGQFLLQQRADLTEESVTLREQYDAQLLHITGMETALAELKAQCEKQRTEVELLASEAAHLDEVRSHLQTRVLTLRREARKLAQAQAEAFGGWHQLRQRQSHLLEARSAAQNTLRQEHERRSALKEEYEAAVQRQRVLAPQLPALERQIQHLTEERETLKGCREELLATRRELERWGARLSERRQLLSQIRYQEYRSGVQTVIMATQQGQLDTISQTVTELLQVPPRLRRAIQAALEDRLEALVVKDMTVARRIIAFLRQSRGGRVTLLPLEDLCISPPVEVPQRKGVIGRADTLVSLVKGPPELLTYLLGRTLVVQDLDTAHHLLHALDGDCQVVTLRGEVLRTDGSLTDGSILESESGPLAREEEWRRLPSEERALEEKLEELNRRERALEARERSIDQTIGSVRAEVQRLRATLEEQTTKAASVGRDLQQSEQAARWHEERITEIERELASLADQESQLQEALQRRDADITHVQRQLTEAITQEETFLTQELDQQRRELENARTALAVRQEALAQQRQRLREAQLQNQQTAQQLQRLASRKQAIDEKLTLLQAEMQRLAQSEEESRRELAQLIAQHQPIAARLQDIRARQQILLQTERSLQQRQRDAEERHHDASLSMARCEDELRKLRGHIIQDLELEMEITTWEPSGPGHQADQLITQHPLPLELTGAPLPKVIQLPEGLAENIHQLQKQLRRHKRVNPLAPKEYAELKKRYDFLMTQASDLEAAAQSLRQVITELDQTMEAQFLNTFEAASAQFTKYFSLLFEGGQAQLVLTEPDNLSQTGVDIHARPPGKRGHRLELLSGGERALTATALIFALLTVSQTPFCLLDEVDAALDEANSRRFRRLLEQLSEHTQFIVITHNRQVVEAADSIYGISMDEDGVSQAISLRLDEVASAMDT